MAKPSLRTELLLNLAVLSAAALLLAIPSALLATILGDGLRAVLLLAGLVVADIAIMVLFGRYLLTRLVTRPVEALVAATDGVARGEFARRAPEAATRELDHLATSVNRMTDRLLDAQGALVRAEKLASVGRLAAGVAHEVGNPLAAIGNYVEVLRRKGADPAIVEALERETDRIDGIVRSLLDYARPRADRHEPVDLARLAHAAVELLQRQGVLRDLALTVDVAADTPSVPGDRSALEQVLVNLLLNAADAAGAGGRVRLVVSRDAAGAAELVVADSGPGVPPEDAARIFDPFFTTKDPGRGTGLGLAIVARTVEDHGGRIRVERAAEGGAAFALTLPADGGGA
jgi:signal transduction histidine kinase